MSHYVEIPRFTCDLCEGIVSGKKPYDCTTRVGTWLQEFHICDQCFAMTGLNSREQDRTLFKRIWRKFFKRKDPLLDKVQTLFQAIRHGDPDHQAWLENAINNHFNLPTKKGTS